MKVIINALSARRGGSKIFFDNLIPRLVRNFSEDTYDVLYTGTSFPFFAKNVRWFDLSSTISSPLRRISYENFELIKLLYKGNYDWYFQIDDSVPPLVYLTGIKTLAVFHASIQSLLPSQLGDSGWKILFWRLLKKLALNRVTVPVTVSYCTKGELACGNERIFRRIQVIYHGVDREIFTPRSRSSGNKLIPELPENYILSVSTRNPHKNYYRVVQAYAQLVKEENRPEHLVLIGAPVWQWEEDRIAKVVKDNGLESRVHIWNNIDHTQLPRIYQGASLYIYASLFDSFGFTPLEAMSCGIPCAVSRFSALPEICGDAVDYFDPLDVQEILTSIKRILNNENYQKELIRAGYKHVSGFNWEFTTQAYHHLLTQKTVSELTI